MTLDRIHEHQEQQQQQKYQAAVVTAVATAAALGINSSRKLKQLFAGPSKCNSHCWSVQLPVLNHSHGFLLPHACCCTFTRLTCNNNND
jgi:hypothetical protein